MANSILKRFTVHNNKIKLSFFHFLTKLLGILCYRVYELINRPDTLKSRRSVVPFKANAFATPLVNTMLPLSLCSSTLSPCFHIHQANWKIEQRPFERLAVERSFRNSIYARYFPLTETFQWKPHSSIVVVLCLSYLFGNKSYTNPFCGPYRKILSLDHNALDLVSSVQYKWPWSNIFLYGPLKRLV